MKLITWLKARIEIRFFNKRQCCYCKEMSHPFSCFEKHWFFNFCKHWRKARIKKIKTYTMNDYIYFKLTEKGKNIWEEKNKSFNERNPTLHMSIKYIGNNWVRDTLWMVFERFGSFISAGTDCCIYDVTFENPERW